ncbi:MAG: hypothetical protein QMD65_00035 [Patescibacteria group bacterium]|nr:hypothetical protein [Patescibacteria group bacterium]
MVLWLVFLIILISLITASIDPGIALVVAVFFGLTCQYLKNIVAGLDDLNETLKRILELVKK